MAELKTQSVFLEKPRIEKLLKSKKDGVLSFTDGKKPYGVPLTYTLYNDGVLYFGLGLSGRKYEYFQKCNDVCFTVFETFQVAGDPLRRGWWSIILDGELSQITDPEEIMTVGDLMEAQGIFPPGLKEKFLGAMLKNPAHSNFFKMKITQFGGKELGEYRPEKEIE